MASGDSDGEGGRGLPGELKREELVYTKCYCEENIYCLVRDWIPPESRRDFTIVFISNSMKTVPLFYQKASQHPPLPVTWDYHVLLVHHPLSHRAFVYDFDTTLPFPCAFDEYCSRTLYGPESWEDLQDLDPLLVQAYLAARPRFFRLVGASEYLRTFASSRMHMMVAGEEGKWLAEPPKYAPIVCELGEDTLERFLDFGVPGNGSGWGRIVDEEGLWKEFVGGGVKG